MKGVPTIASIPVNLLSEYSIEGAVAKACDMEANECPVKPFLAAELTASRVAATAVSTPSRIGFPRLPVLVIAPIA